MPARTGGVPDQLHSTLAEELVALPDVAGQAGAHNVLPARLASAGDRDDVVERKLRGGKLLAAVLAAVAVPEIDVAAGELHFLPREAVKRQKLDDGGYQDEAVGGADVVIVRLHGDVGPVAKIVGTVLRVDRFDLTLVEKGERPPCGCDLHRLEDSVEDEHVTVEHKIRTR